MKSIVKVIIMAKAMIKIITARKEFSKQDLDAFRRILNVLLAHNLAVSLTVKKKVKGITNIKLSELRYNVDDLMSE